MPLLTARVPVCAVYDRQLHQLSLFQLILAIGLRNRKHHIRSAQVRSRAHQVAYDSGREQLQICKHAAPQLIYNGAQRRTEQDRRHYRVARNNIYVSAR